MDDPGYVGRAKQRVLDILADQHATVVLELESRIAEAAYADAGININPHHVTTALQELRAEGAIVRVSAPVRGGGQDIDTIQPANQHRRKTVIAEAAARKRLLYARYRGWAQGTVRHPHGLIGPAGEQSVRGGILLSGALQPASPDAGEVSQLLNVALPGPVDSAGYMVPLVNGLPMSTVTVLIEVKNIRSWIYPSSIELYQLLNKAAILQQARRDYPILPILVCRKAHQTTFWMAQQLGFMVIDMGLQYAGDVDKDALDEVRLELHFDDLRVGAEPSLRVRDRLQKVAPGYSVKSCPTWQATTDHAQITSLITALHDSRAKAFQRAGLMQTLRAVIKHLGYTGGW